MKETLKWYIEMGVDEVVSDTTSNRFEPPKKKPEIDTKIATPIIETKIDTQPTNFEGPLDMVSKTQKAASKCETLADLEKEVRAFKGISLTKTATNVVFADGVSDSDVMLIGEAPGAEEDARGIPFCGASGKMLDSMLIHVGLEREKNFYITNTIFWRPPGNRRPTPEELAICKPFVEKHIALVKPKLIILVGGTAVTSVLGDKQGISKLRGKFFDYENEYLDEPIKITAIFHPSYLLRSPGQKRLAWRDALMIKHHLDG